MHPEDFEIERLESLEVRQQVTLAEQLVSHLPEGFAFEHVQLCSLVTENHPVAFFEWLPSGTASSAWCQGTFALIPGGTVTLGYDRGNPWSPSSAQQKSWDLTQEEYGVPDLPQYLDKVMTPLRTVYLKPFLMEVSRIETKVFPLDVSLFPHLSPSRWLPEAQFEEELLPVLQRRAEIHVNTKYAADIVEDSREFGFRSPTADEWEWSCAAGSRTMWRWGNYCPTNDYPNSSGWNWHKRPNAFGLTIADDDYQPDYCEDGTVRGGDGGSASCGGAGALDAWLLLASSHYMRGEKPSSTIQARGTRRVFPLDLVLS